MTRVEVKEVVQGVQIGRSERSPPTSNLSDVRVSDTQGIGVRFYTGRATVRRLAIERSLVTGILLDQVSMMGEDFLVDAIPPAADVKPSLRGVALGVGPGFTTGDLEFAAIELERFTFRGSGSAGIWLGLNAEVQFTGGWIEGFATSVSTGKPDFDFETNLAGIRMPRPEEAPQN